MITPEVGMGATLLMWTDRHAATIVQVINDKTIAIQQDFATLTSGDIYKYPQEYTFEPNPTQPILIFTLRKNGRWILRGDPMTNGQALAVGTRSEYYDPSF